MMQCTIEDNSNATIKVETSRVSSIKKITFSHLLNESTESSDEKVFQLIIPGKDTVRSVTNTLSPHECEEIINATSTTQEGFSRPPQFSTEVRECQRIHTVDKNMSSIIFPRLRPYLPEIVKIDGVRWRITRFTHHWRYVRYYSGGHFRPHYDGAKMSAIPNPCMTIFTVQIYLNGKESFTGGSTRFYPDYVPQRNLTHEIDYGKGQRLHPFSNGNIKTYPVKPEIGKALMFNHALNTLHDGEAVGEGIKYIMRGDVIYTALPEDVHHLPLIGMDGNQSIIPPHMRHWCPFTAERYGTRNHVGEVWYCECATDKHGEDVETNSEVLCWHMDKTYHSSTQVTNDTLIKSGQVNPKVFVLTSGKRATGKDYITNILEKLLTAKGFNVYRTALGSINKHSYAKKVKIDVEQLLNDRNFKESHRVAMIEHHRQQNLKDPEWCFKVIMNQIPNNIDVFLLSDLRTLADLTWFKKQEIPTVLLRISASDKARVERGWKPCAIKDALYTETELDEYYNWTACWDNSENTNEGNFLIREWLEFTVVPRISALM